VLLNYRFFKLFLKLLLFYSFGCFNAHAEIKAYGIFDSGVSLVSNGDLETISVTSGTGTASRLGVRGSESLNAQLSAEFLIETFITLDNGSNYGLESSYNSSTFGGFKYKKFIDQLAVQTELSIRFGRQRSVLHDRLYLYDPMRQNLIGSPTGFAMYSMFYNKMVKIIAKIKQNQESVHMRLMYIPGSYNASANKKYSPFDVSHEKIPFGSWGASIRWDKYPFSIKTGFQTEKRTLFRAQNDSFLSVFRYTLNYIDFYTGYLSRTPGRQVFLSNEENIKSECFYLGIGMPLKRILPNLNGNSSIFFSFARPRMKSLDSSEGVETLKQNDYFANQWGIAIKKPLSKKTAFYFFAGEIQNFGQSRFSLEAIPYDIKSARGGGNPSVIGFSLNQRY
jgi:predicted porin